MNAKGVDFVFYPSTDYERSMAFYRDTLGLKVGVEKKGVYAEFDAGNLTLMVGVYGDPPKNGQQSGGAIVALSVEDVAKAIDELKARNVPIVMNTSEYEPCYMAMIKDPDGNQIMLHHRKDGSVG